MIRNTPQSHARRGFSLTELLVVISIIVILLALGLPALSSIRGDKSIAGATNQLAGVLGRARAQAIGVQKITGIMFYIDPATDRRNAVMVQETTSIAGVDVTLGLASPGDNVVLPDGVDVQTIADGNSTATTPTVNDRYIGFNNQVGLVQYGGVILFDGTGRLYQGTYGFRCIIPGGTATDFTDLGNLMDRDRTDGATVIPGNPGFYPAPNGGSLPLESQLGFALFDRDKFGTAVVPPGYPSAGSSIAVTTQDYRVTSTPAAVPAVTVAVESMEEAWIDSNSTPILINRYNGTLIKSQ